MANKSLFKTASTRKHPVTDTVNEAGGRAYAYTDKHAISQYAVTGCFSNTYYANADDQLNKVKELAVKLDSEFLAKLAVYARQSGKMKDMPAFLLAILASRGENALLAKVFPKVINNAKMLCNFVQIVRSGVTGRKSFGTATKRLIQNWLASREDDRLWQDSVGQGNPSLADIIKMVHPRPENVKRDALYRYLLGKEFKLKDLPKLVRDFEAFKGDNTKKLPNVPFRVLTNCNLTVDHWTQIAKDMPWNTLRMNLNMLSRNGVLKDEAVVAELAAKLRDAEEVRKSNAFPYQLLTAYLATTDVPVKITNALQDALEAATTNVPSFGVKTAVCIDVSGSMSSAITGNRGSVTSKTRCVDVAGLIAATILRNNEEAGIVPFDTGVHQARINPRDSVMSNAKKLATYGGGGTDCSSALKHLNSEGEKFDLVIVVSDNQSWVDFSNGRYTGMNAEWVKFKRKNPKAKLVLIDLQPYGSTQVQDDKDVLNVGSFSDEIWEIIANFANGNKDNFVSAIENVEI